MKPALKLLLMVLAAGLCLQLFFVLRIASLRWIDPESTSFQRSQIWQVWQRHGSIAWSQEWVPMARISPQLQRAVLASEDDIFAQHDGIRWDSVEKAWDRNAKAQAQAQRQAQRGSVRTTRVVGGSTITQQLAKNLFLSGERTLWRKAQEAWITLWLEALLDKRRILEIYLNHVEWGEGVFGAQAAARHYFQKDAQVLVAWEAARLAVMLPRPRFYELRPQSVYLAERADVIVQRMGSVELPR